MANVKIQWAQQARSLVTAALGSRGRASWQSPDTLLVELAGAPPLSFRVSKFDGTGESRAQTRTLWLLKRPRESVLENLRARGQSFVALNGTVRIEGQGVLIDRSGLKPPPTDVQRKVRRSAFSDRASMIPRWLFDRPCDSEWTVSHLAGAAGVSPSVASYAVNDLRERAVVGVRRAGRRRLVRLIEHRRLVEQWVHEYDWRDNVVITVSAPIGSVPRFLRRLPSLPLPRWALTLHAGATQLLRHAPVEKVAAFIDVPSIARVDALIVELGWPYDPSGRFSFLIPHYQKSLWPGCRQVDHELPVVSDLQLILDLWHHPIRGREQAELLLEKHIDAL